VAIDTVTSASAVADLKTVLSNWLTESNNMNNTEFVACLLSVSLNDAPGNVQMEVTDLQCISG
jgi:hypothetical protein